MQLQHAYYLPWIGAVLISGLLWWYWMGRTTAKINASFHPKGRKTGFQVSWSNLALVLVLPILLLALAGPTWGEEAETVFTSGEDLYFVIDCSYSMSAADIAPSRLQAAAYLALSILKELPGARAGLLVFAGSAFPACPLTFDRGVMRTLLASLNPSMLNHQGTNFEAPLRVLSRILAGRDQQRRLVVVFLSDGEMFVPPSTATIQLTRGVMQQVIAIGIGTPDGALIADPRTAGRSWVKDSRGQPVRTVLNEERLQELADRFQGAYLRLQTVGLTSHLLLEQYLKTPVAGSFSIRKKPKNQSFLAVWIALALVSFAWIAKVFPSRRLNRRKAAVFVLAACCCGGFGTAFSGYGFADRGTAAGSYDAGATRVLLQHGNLLCGKGQHAQAIPIYRRALEQAAARSPVGAAAAVNLTQALIMTGDFRAAAEQARTALRAGAAEEYRSDLWYNLGCAQWLAGSLDLAAASFRQSLELAPGDYQALWNLDLLLRRMSAPQPPPPSPRDTQDPAERLLDSLKEQEKNPVPRQNTGRSRMEGPFW